MEFPRSDAADAAQQWPGRKIGLSAVKTGHRVALLLDV